MPRDGARPSESLVERAIRGPRVRGTPKTQEIRKLTPNSFDAKATLTVGERSLRDLPPRRAPGEVRHRPAAVLAEDPAREPAAQRGRRVDPRAGHRGARAAGTRRRSRARRSRSRRRAWSCRTSPACPRSSTSPRCATRCAEMGGDPNKINPLVPAELVIDHSVQVDVFGSPRRVRAQRRARVRAQPGALRVPALGPGRVPQLRGRPAGHRDRPPGQPRVPRARRVRRRRRVRAHRSPTPTRSSAPTRTRR